jgi:predicted DNA-binding transcriptional regulator AlpA
VLPHRRGHNVYTCRLASPHPTVNTRRLMSVSPEVNTEDLIDAQGVAELLGVTHRNTVSTYQRRYPDMPRPVVDLGAGRPRLWLRSHIEAWIHARVKDG